MMVIGAEGNTADTAIAASAQTARKHLPVIRVSVLLSMAKAVVCLNRATERAAAAWRTLLVPPSLSRWVGR